MSIRLFALAALAVAPLALAAPAPFLPPATPPQPEVELRGPHPGTQLGAVPPVVTTEAAYRGVAEALSVKSPPAVNFRTHFLLVLVTSGHGLPRFEVIGDGLHTVGGPADDVPQAARLLVIKCGKSAMSSGYLIKSFPRSAVKTVNGVPVPRS